MLDTLAPTDPILLLAIVDGPFSSLPRDVREWFGPTRDNRVQLTIPNSQQREDFFGGLLKDIQRPPNQFADGVKRRRRVLEELPIAPPIEPRKPTAAELALQEENDHRVITLLRYRLGPIMAELKRKFKRFTKRATVSTLVLNSLSTLIPESQDEYAFEPMQQQVETVAQTVDVHLNGIIEIVDENRMNIEPPINVHVEADSMDAGLRQQQMQQMEARGPPLFDMDLERMHKDLYKDKYLTPQDFLDDVGKIVHNADIRRDEDPDRLFKAQAMYTAAEVSIQDFDPTLRLECDRMATRERQRREERKKNKGKGKATDSNGQNGTLGTRRSARHNGQAPELGITDPLQLERRLKRQRPDEEAAASQGSGEENSENRTVKKSKVVVSDDDDNDPLDVVGPTSSQPRPHAVRFATIVEPMEPLLQTPLPNGNDASPERMVVDPLPQRNHGFDQSLLNPLPASDDVFSAPSINGMNDSLPGPSTSHSLPTMDIFRSHTHVFSPPHSNHPSPPRTPVPIQHPLPPPFEKQPSPAPMVVERTPTPPHPDFHVDDMLLSSLKFDLRESTHSLTVEQLEQLRATSLGCTWRHRSDWDRDNLVHEVKNIVREFVGEVAADDADEAGSPERRW
jgi:ATPase family AAA domain-containing protein 2